MTQTIKLTDIEDIAYQLKEWKDDVNITTGVVKSVYLSILDEELNDLEEFHEKVEDLLIELSSTPNHKKMWTYNGQLVSLYGVNKWYLDDTETPFDELVKYLFTDNELSNSPFNIDKLVPFLPSDEDLLLNLQHEQEINKVFNS